MNVSVEKINLQLKQPFRLSRGTTSVRENLLVNIGGNYGEGAPLYYLGQTADEILPAVMAILDSPALGVDFEYLRDNPWPSTLLNFPKPALCAASMAVYGYLAAQDGKPLYEYLSLPKPKDIPTSFSIGIVSPDQLEMLLTDNPNFPAYKLKMGSDDDISVVKRFREISDAELRLDANGGWELEEAVGKFAALEKYDIEFIEQPLAAGNLDALDELTTRTNIPVFADEDLNNFSDILDLNGKVHGINVKLSKCGLLFDSLRIIQYAKQLDMKVLLGCMVESSVGITAALHLATLVDYIDLDGNLLVSNDPFVGASVENGILNLTDRTGVGVNKR